MQGHPVTILKGTIIVLKKIWMPFRDGFLMILLQAAHCTKSLVDQHQREQECQRLAININLKLWTEKAFGSFRGYHRFSTTLNSAQLSSQLKAQNCGALLHICRLTDLTRKFSLGTSNLWYFARHSSQRLAPPSIKRGTQHSFLGRGQPERRNMIPSIFNKEATKCCVIQLIIKTNLPLKVAF